MIYEYNNKEWNIEFEEINATKEEFEIWIVDRQDSDNVVHVSELPDKHQNNLIEIVMDLCNNNQEDYTQYDE